MLRRCRELKNWLVYDGGRRFYLEQKRRILLWSNLFLTVRGWRCYRAWRQSLKPGHSPVRDRYPLITFGARRWLDDHLTPDMTVFEYGSGGSTLYFCQRVKHVVSVEHDSVWFMAMTRILEEAGVQNCQRLLRRPEPMDGSEPSYGPESYTSCFQQHQGCSYRAYVQAIEAFPDHCFDLVLVDGRARASCLALCIGKVKPGGFIMLDNSDRPQYADATALLKDWDHQRFAGIGPNCHFVWATTVWQAPCNDAPE